MKKTITTLALIFGVALVSVAQDASSTQFQTEFLGMFNAAATKIDGLANAISAEDYEWAPAEGVRSIREAILHVTAANYFIGSMLGAQVPEGLNVMGLESDVKTKDEAIKHLNNSFEFVRKAAGMVKPADLSKEIDLFGSPATVMTAMYVITDHMSEHLGQLIAYARANEVTPPWSN